VTLLAEVAAPDSLGPLLFANHNPNYGLDFEHERELQAVTAARAIEELVGRRRLHVVVAGDFDATPDAASGRIGVAASRWRAPASAIGTPGRASTPAIRATPSHLTTRCCPRGPGRRGAAGGSITSWCAASTTGPPWTSRRARASSTSRSRASGRPITSASSPTWPSRRGRQLSSPDPPGGCSLGGQAAGEGEAAPPLLTRLQQILDIRVNRVQRASSTPASPTPTARATGWLSAPSWVGTLLLSMGGAMLAAPMVLPLLWWAARTTGRGPRGRRAPGCPGGRQGRLGRCLPDGWRAATLHLGAAGAVGGSDRVADAGHHRDGPARSGSVARPAGCRQPQPSPRAGSRRSRPRPQGRSLPR
jgi:hypothetical protein